MQALAADENQLTDLTGTIAVAERESLPDIPVCPAFACLCPEGSKRTTCRMALHGGPIGEVVRASAALLFSAVVDCELIKGEKSQWTDERVHAFRLL